jgi:hypothetical protein
LATNSTPFRIVLTGSRSSRWSELPLDLSEQTRKIDRLGIEVAATDLDAAATIAFERVGCQCDYGRRRGRQVRSNEPCRFPPIHSAQRDVHQNQIRFGVAGQLHASRPILGTQNLVTSAAQTPTQHVAIGLVIFDKKDSMHGLLSLSCGFGEANLV